jgi:hypothetical protein
MICNVNGRVKRQVARACKSPKLLERQCATLMKVGLIDCEYLGRLSTGNASLKGSEICVCAYFDAFATPINI